MLKLTELIFYCLPAELELEVIMKKMLILCNNKSDI